MQFSESWLRSLIETDMDIVSICEMLTKAGLELETLTPVLPNSKGLVVAKIIKAENHPTKNKLTVCQIEAKGQIHQVVCGATNVRDGLNVVWAPSGSKLQGIDIGSKKFDNIESNGFLCSKKEIGMSEDSSSKSIFELPENAPIGECAINYLKLDDNIIDISITPNRGDCISVIGIAREIHALTNAKLNSPKIKESKPSIDKNIDIEIKNKKGCSAYFGRVIENINPKAKSPFWLTDRLSKSGIRPISVIVDVTNYVMLELGQPMHAFDLNFIKEKIIVRNASNNEKMKLLDESEIELNENDLIISDTKSPLALAGIMGGENSGINHETTNIFLESATFDPIQVANSSRRHKIVSDSSFRFERGVDFNLPKTALEYATQLILEISGGKPGPISFKQSNKKVHKKINLRFNRANKVLGTSIDKKEIINIMKKLSMEIKEFDEYLEVIPPSYRNDIHIEEDLIEEIARIYGYDNIEQTPLVTSLDFHPNEEGKKTVNAIKNTMLDLGYNEVITYSFIDKKTIQELYPKTKLIEIINPISQEMSTMRPTLLIGLLETLKYNQRRKNLDVKIFETGLCFEKFDSSINQIEKIAGIFSGTAQNVRWNIENRPVDFYDIKGDVEFLLNKSMGSLNKISFRKSNNKTLHPGQSAEILFENEIIGEVGAIHPEITNKLEIKGNVFYFEFYLNKITKSEIPVFQEISKFPNVTRDLALILDKSINFKNVNDSITSKVPNELIFSVNLFDVYTGPGIPDNKKSLALRINLQHPTRTLIDEEINDIMGNVIKELELEYEAELRATA